MGYAWLLVIGVAAFVLLWRMGLPRRLWSFVGAALMLGAAGYAWQGRPSVSGSPVVAQSRVIDVDPALAELRDRMFGRFTRDAAYLIASDAMLRAGDAGSAVNVAMGGIRAIPKSAELWTGLGTTYAIHDGDQVSPPAAFAFRRAMQIAPLHPAPPFFLGMAYVRAGQFAKARPAWARALALTPPGASYRPEIAFRLALLDRYIALAEQANGAAGP